MLYHTVNMFLFKGAWLLKTRAYTEQVYVDEVEVDEEGIAEMLMDDTSIAQVASKNCKVLYKIKDNV